jgi:hypothetical protein
MSFTTHLGQRAILRHELDAMEKRFPLCKPMGVIGYGMGGAMPGCCSSRVPLNLSSYAFILVFGNQKNIK